MGFVNPHFSPLHQSLHHVRIQGLWKSNDKQLGRCRRAFERGMFWVGKAFRLFEDAALTMGHWRHRKKGGRNSQKKIRKGHAFCRKWEVSSNFRCVELSLMSLFFPRKHEVQMLPPPPMAPMVPQAISKAAPGEVLERLQLCRDVVS